MWLCVLLEPRTLRGHTLETLRKWSLEFPSQELSALSNPQLVQDLLVITRVLKSLRSGEINDPKCNIRYTFSKSMKETGFSANEILIKIFHLDNYKC